MSILGRHCVFDRSATNVIWLFLFEFYFWGTWDCVMRVMVWYAVWVFVVKTQCPLAGVKVKTQVFV